MDNIKFSRQAPIRCAPDAMGIIPKDPGARCKVSSMYTDEQDWTVSLRPFAQLWPPFLFMHVVQVNG